LIAKALEAAATDPGVVYTSVPVGVLSVGERRLEGETYLTGGYAFRTKIEASGAHAPLSDAANVWQPGRLKGIAVSQQQGVPFLTATQVFDIRPSPRKWLAPSRTPDSEKRLVQRDWILVTRSGSVGDVILAYQPHLGVLISDDLLRVEPKKASDLGYLYAFLRSRYGRAMLRSSHYGSIIKHLEPEHLDSVPVPTVPRDVCDTLSDRVRRVFQLRDEAFELMREAETRYFTELGVDRLGAADESAYSIPASEMFHAKRRLDGYHYNPAAEAALHMLASSGRPLAPLGSLVQQVSGVPRFKHVYTEEGTPYLDSEDVFKINPELRKFIPQISKRDAATYFVKRGWLLMACSGQLYGLNGSVMLADRWHENKIVSNHVIRIVPCDGSTAVRPGYLQVALGHPLVGRPLVLRLAFGTEVPEIAPEDLRDFPVPRLSASSERAIADCVERASALRMEADGEENAAVAFVEQVVDRSLHRAAAPAKVLDGNKEGRGHRQARE
jgi:hypothetical protein